MMGSKLKLEQLSDNATGLHSKFRWFGKVMGFTMDFTVIVTKWIKDVEKVWETTGKAEMIILSWYRMHLFLSPEGKDTRAELSIAYTLPKNIFLKIFAFFIAPWYARWCLNKMLQDSKMFLEATPNQ